MKKEFNWLDNYEGRTEIAKRAMDSTMSTYNNSSYITWSMMHLVLMYFDPNFKFRVIRNKEGGYLHTERYYIDIDKEIEEHNKDGLVKRTVEKEHSAMQTFFVEVEIDFLGETHNEVYPIRGKDGKSALFVDSMLMNNAIQRAKAKLASQVTGVGLTLWTREEISDLEEIENGGKPLVEKKVTAKPTVKPTPKPTPKVVEQTAEDKAKALADLKAKNSKPAEKPAEEPMDLSLMQAKVEDHMPNMNEEDAPMEPIDEMAMLLFENKEEPKVLALMKVFNQTIKAKGGNVIDIESDDFLTIKNKLKVMPSLPTMLATLKRQVGGN